MSEPKIVKIISEWGRVKTRPAMEEVHKYVKDGKVHIRKTTIRPATTRPKHGYKRVEAIVEGQGGYRYTCHIDIKKGEKTNG